jgi:hypothetical protein
MIDDDDDDNDDCRMQKWKGKLNYSLKTCPNATLCSKIPTWPDPGSNLGRRGGHPATDPPELWHGQNKDVTYITLLTEKCRSSRKV